MACVTLSPTGYTIAYCQYNKRKRELRYNPLVLHVWNLDSPPTNTNTHTHCDLHIVQGKYVIGEDKRFTCKTYVFDIRQRRYITYEEYVCINSVRVSNSPVSAFPNLPSTRLQQCTNSNGSWKLENIWLFYQEWMKSFSARIYLINLIPRNISLSYIIKFWGFLVFTFLLVKCLNKLNSPTAKKLLLHQSPKSSTSNAAITLGTVVAWAHSSEATLTPLDLSTLLIGIHS